MGRALEITKVPAGGGVVRLHALQRVNEEGLALEVDRAVLGGDGSLGHTPGPEGVAHRAPWVLQIGSEQRPACLANLETRRGPLERQVDHGPVVVHRLDRVRRSVLREFDCAVGGVEGGPVVAELMVVELGRAPEMLLGLVEAEDLDVELARCSNAAGPCVSCSMRPSGEDAKRTPRYYR